MSHPSTECQLIEQAWRQGPAPFDELLAVHADRLKRMVRIRLDEHLKGHIRPADVVRQAAEEAFRRVGEYLGDPQVSFFVWIRSVTLECLARVHGRRWNGDGSENTSLYRGTLPQATSAAIAAHLVGQLAAPHRIEGADRRQQLHLALHQMNEREREVLCLRHFEQLSQRETAEVLGIDEQAASARHLRALAKLQTILK